MAKSVFMKAILESSWDFSGVAFAPKRLTKDGFESMLGVNHIGHFLLGNMLLDLLKVKSVFLTAFFCCALLFFIVKPKTKQF